jgi:hypothetical protein
VPTNQHIKARAQWIREGKPSHFQISNFQIVFNDWKAEDPSRAFE